VYVRVGGEGGDLKYGYTDSRKLMCESECAYIRGLSASASVCVCYSLSQVQFIILVMVCAKLKKIVEDLVSPL